MSDISGFGQGYNLAQLDIKESLEWAGSGATIFSEIDSCISSSNNADVSYSYEFYEEQHDFATSLGITTDGSLSASVADYSASLTVTSAFSSSSSSSSSLSSSSLRQKQIMSQYSITSSCYASEASYSPDFITAFQALPTELNLGSTGWSSVPTASTDSSWVDYASFISTWGSHVITGAHCGAMVEVLATASSDSDSDESDFKSMTCASAGALGISASECVGYDTASSSSSSSSSISVRAYFYGGDPKLAVDAQDGSSSSALGTFLKSGDTTTVAYFTYTPIWTLLGDLYGSSASSDNIKRVAMLKGYYASFLAEMSAAVDACWVADVDYNDNDFSDTGVDSAAECQAKCADSSSCSYWTLREDDQCYLKTSDTGFRISSGSTSGAKACNTKREAGYEVLVTESTETISFEVMACEFPIATSSECTQCGNIWSSYTDTDYNPDGCSWWSCAEYTLNYCSSPNMQTLPDNWITRTTPTSHYGDPSNGCLADELSMTVSGFDGSFCSSLCGSDGSCSADTSKGVSAKPACTLTAADGTQYCALVCSTSTSCGSGMCVSNDQSTSFCMYS